MPVIRVQGLGRQEECAVAAGDLVSDVVARYCEAHGVPLDSVCVAVDGKILDVRGGLTVTELAADAAVVVSRANTVPSHAQTVVVQQHHPHGADSGVAVLRSGNRRAVLLDNSAVTNSRVELPDSFYDVTAEDAQAISQSLQQRADPSVGGHLWVTREYREMHVPAKRPPPSVCHLRLKLTDGSTVQAEFAPTETVRNVKDFLQQELFATPVSRLSLHQFPPRRLLQDDNASLQSLGLAPTGVLHVVASEPVALQPWAAATAGSASAEKDQSASSSAPVARNGAATSGTGSPAGSDGNGSGGSSSAKEKMMAKLLKGMRPSG